MALRRLAPGPGNWIRPCDLQQLQRCYGHPYAFPSFKNMALAAKLRLQTYEPQLQLDHQAAALSELAPLIPARRSRWQTWYQNSYVLILQNAKAEAARKGVTTSSSRKALLQDLQHISPLHVEQHVKNKFQSQAMKALLYGETYNHEDVTRRKLKR